MCSLSIAFAKACYQNSVQKSLTITVLAEEYLMIGTYLIQNSMIMFSYQLHCYYLLV